MKRKICDTGKTKRKIKHSSVTKRLNAKKTDLKINTKQNSISLLALRHLFIEQLKSSGGRPSLVGSTKTRNKIPLIDGDWKILKRFSEYYKEKEGINISSGQIAAVLLHKQIVDIDISELKKIKNYIDFEKAA